MRISPHPAQEPDMPIGTVAGPGGRHARVSARDDRRLPSGSAQNPIRCVTFTLSVRCVATSSSVDRTSLYTT